MELFSNYIGLYSNYILTRQPTHGLKRLTLDGTFASRYRYQDVDDLGIVTDPSPFSVVC